MPEKSRLPARNAATAISLAAFSTIGQVPPAASACDGEPQRRKPFEIRRRELEFADSGQVQPAPRRLEPDGVAKAMGDGHAHVGHGQAGGHGAVPKGDEAVHDGLRVNQHVQRVRP